MLTYATLADFKRMKNIDYDDSSMDNWIKDNLQRATRYISRYTRREFFPFLEERKFPIPNKILDLSRRRLTTANLFLDKDLMEALLVTNGNGVVLTNPSDYFLIEHNIKPKFAVSLVFPNFWTTSQAYSSFNFDFPEVAIYGWWGYHESEFDNAFISTYTATPVAGLTSSQLTFTVPDAEIMDEDGNQAFSEGALLKLEDDDGNIELVTVNAVNIVADTITVARGQRGTEALTWPLPVSIKKFRVHEDISQVCLMITKLWREYGEAAGTRLGVSDTNTTADQGLPPDPLNILKSYVRMTTS